MNTIESIVAPVVAIVILVFLAFKSAKKAAINEEKGGFNKKISLLKNKYFFLTICCLMGVWIAADLGFFVPYIFGYRYPVLSAEWTIHAVATSIISVFFGVVYGRKLFWREFHRL